MSSNMIYSALLLVAAARAIGIPPAVVVNSNDHVSLVQTHASAHSKEPQWPQPGDPSFTVTPDHRLQVAAFKNSAEARNVEGINNTIIGMCCVPVALFIEEGVHDAIFGVLREYQDDKYQYVQQSAWRGLSDQSATELGSKVIANVGGRNQGIEYMVNQMKAHPEPYYALCADRLTLKYEILACISGLLRQDRDNERGPAAVQAGLLEQVVYTMRAEPDLIASQATACGVMDLLLRRNPQYVAPLLRLGALEKVETAIERFKGGDDTPFHFGFTMGQIYNTNQACRGPRNMLLAGRAASP